MKQTYLAVGDDDWGVVVCYDFDVRDEADEMSAVMDAFGMNGRSIDKALCVLSTMNSGMAVSRDDLRMSVVFIGRATSCGQFWNSVSHELHHVATAITDYYGEPYHGEPSAYLHGTLMEEAYNYLQHTCK